MLILYLLSRKISYISVFIFLFVLALTLAPVAVDFMSVFICLIVLALRLVPVAVELASKNEELYLIIIRSRLQSRIHYEK